MIRFTSRILNAKGMSLIDLPFERSARAFRFTRPLIKSSSMSTVTSRDISCSPEWNETLEAAKSETKNISLRLNEIIKEVLNYDFVKDVPIVHQHLSKMLPYTVIGGKMARGAAVVTSVQKIRGQSLTRQDLVDARTLGAAIELLQAHFLVADDIMDGSITRRGQPCWYRIGGNGLGAINDALILNAVVNVMLGEHFKSHPCCVEICQLFNRVTLLTDIGQSADTLVSNPSEDGRINWDMYTAKNYNDIVKYKTAFYTTVLPVRFALYSCNHTDARVHETAEHILLKIGHLFQVQDDFLDCYQSAQQLGKMGTDIENGKCSWTIITALSIASPEQIALLKSNYGKQDPKAVAIVKSIYNDLEIPKVYSEFEKSNCDNIMQLMHQWDEKGTGIPKSLFLSVFAPLYKRAK